MRLRRLAEAWESLRQNPVSHWSLLFVVLCVTVPMNDNNANPYSRYALLSAIAEDRSVAIDRYQASTCDWARPPDRRYYSNNAPGPALLAVPLHAPVDAALVAGLPHRTARDARRIEARDAVLAYLSLALQAIPFALVVMLAARRLVAWGASFVAVQLAVLAMLFGNTASLLMNMFYGHGMAALLTLGMLLALLDRRMALTGLLLGLNVLCDYGSALYLPIVASVVVLRGARDLRNILHRTGRFALGGLGPLMVFAAYHWACFGGPFTLPNKYQNPVFVEKNARAIWGVIDLLPSWPLFEELLVGTRRSLLVTQGWVLALAACIPLFWWPRGRWRPETRAVAPVVLFVSFSGLLLLLAMNASFGGWHGGVCPGPRYLSAALPAVALALGLSYDAFPRPVRLLLWLSVLPALALFAIIWAGDLAIWPQHRIWGHCWAVLRRYRSPALNRRLAWIVVVLVVGALVTVFRWRARPAERSG